MSVDGATLLETLTFRAGYNTALVTAGTTLLGLASGVVGVFATLRKRALVADALSHATLPGIGIAFVIAGAMGVEGRTLPVLLLGAALTGVLGVVCVQAMVRRTRLTEDAAIGIVLSVFFGAGVVVLSYIQRNRPDGSAGLTAFIYGQAATMSAADVALMAGIAGGAVLGTLLLLKEFSLVAFNDTFARVDGWPVSVIDLLMMAMIVVVTVAGIQAVGLIMVVALLIIPAAAARFWTDRLWVMLAVAALIGGLSGYAGSVVSAMLPRKPAGAVIVLTAGGVFVISMFVAPARGVVSVLVQRLVVRVRIACDHVLEEAYESGLAALSPEDVRVLSRVRGWPRWFRWVLRSRLRLAGLASAGAGGEIVLSPRGAERGARVSRNHALWEQYLISFADIAPSHVDWSVDQVEHVLSDQLVARLETRLAERGIEIPGASGS